MNKTLHSIEFFWTNIFFEKDFKNIFVYISWYYLSQKCVPILPPEFVILSKSSLPEEIYFHTSSSVFGQMVLEKKIVEKYQENFNDTKVSLV